MSSPSLILRGILALILMVGFYLLAIGLSVGLIAIPVLEFSAGRVHPKLDLMCLFGGVVILWSVVPRIDRFAPPGPRLDEAAQPELFRSVAEIARRTGQRMPEEIYLVPKLNAFVAQRGGLMGFFGRRVMGIGL